MDESRYPKRPPFFANKFCRLMSKVCLANQHGSDVAWLLAVVVGVEDAKGYREPVTFYNEQLMPLAGIRSVKTLARIRARAVSAGWLHYEPGARGVPCRYWVIKPPHLDGMDDAPVDENPAEYRDLEPELTPDSTPTVSHNRESIGNRNGSSSGAETGVESGENRENSLTLPKDTNPDSKTKSTEPETDSVPIMGPPPDVVLTFPTVGKGPREYYLTLAQVKDWSTLFPALDVFDQCCKALAWIQTHPKKTAGGMPKFLVGWLTRSTDNNRGSNGHTKQPNLFKSKAEKEIDFMAEQFASVFPPEDNTRDNATIPDVGSLPRGAENSAPTPAPDRPALRAPPLGLP